MTENPGHTAKGWLPLALGALGVVFGDIGTSPLYAIQTVFSIDHNMVKATPGDVYGVISMVFWSITLVVSMKYVSSSCGPTTTARAASWPWRPWLRRRLRPGGRRFGL